MWWFLSKIGGSVFKLLTGGGLSAILDTINQKMSDDVQKEQLKAEVTETWIKAQAELLVGRTWWFQLFFVLPLSWYWCSVIADSIFGSFSWWSHVTYALPSPLGDWAAWMISALFIVDGSKAILGRWSK